LFPLKIQLAEANSQKALLYTGIASSVLLARSCVFLVVGCVYEAPIRPYSNLAGIIFMFFYLLLTPVVCIFLVLVGLQPEWMENSADEPAFFEPNIQYPSPSPPPLPSMDNRVRSSYSYPNQPTS